MVTKQSNTARKRDTATAKPDAIETATGQATPSRAEVAAAPPPATSLKTTTPARISDGFDAVIDANGKASPIKGVMIKFTNNAEWIDSAGEVIAAERKLIVIEISKVTQKWIDGLPVETHTLAADQYFPDVERLNAEAPQSEWRDAFGKRAGPWQNSIMVYLFDPDSAEGFTWPTSTAGGFRAVDELQGRVLRIRAMRGAHYFPIVTLADTFMNTQFGGRQRPQFKVVDFVALGSDTEQQSLLAKPTDPNSDMGGDGLPF
jgi:hypothetical protein